MTSWGRSPVPFTAGFRSEESPDVRTQERPPEAESLGGTRGPFPRREQVLQAKCYAYLALLEVIE